MYWKQGWPRSDMYVQKRHGELLQTHQAWPDRYDYTKYLQAYSIMRFVFRVHTIEEGYNLRMKGISEGQKKAHDGDL